MRIIYSIGFFILSYSNLFSQGKDDFYKGKLPFKYLDITGKSYTGASKLLFTDFEVMDARADTGKIGYFSGHFNKVYKLGLEKGVKEDIGAFLFGYYKPVLTDNGCSVLIVIRKLWFSQYDSLVHVKTSDVLITDRVGLLRLKLEFYLKKAGDYYPLYRFDSSINMVIDPGRLFSEATWNNELTIPNVAATLANGIISATGKLFEKDPGKIVEKERKLTLIDITRFSTRPFDVPVLSAVKYKKGIYLSFANFQQNQPGNDYVSVDMDKYGDVLFVKDEKGNEYPTNKVWGYCDGENLFITSGRNFFKLIRTQNSFEFYGIKNIRERFNYKYTYTNPNGESPTMLHKKKPKMNLFPYQVDMETGEVL